MPSNFDFLANDWQHLQPDALEVESNAFKSPRTAAFYARRVLEQALNWLYEHDSALKMPYEQNLATMLYASTFKNNIKPALHNQLKFIHRIGNLAVHDNAAISSREGLQITTALHQFLGWLARVYTRGSCEVVQFQVTYIPKGDDTSADASLEKIQELQNAVAERDEAHAAAQAELEASQAELERLRAQIQAVKVANLPMVAADDYSEAETRDAFIDVMLREAGWDPKGRNVEEYEVAGMPTRDGSRDGVGYVDYVLWGQDGKPVGLVEAKRTKKDPREGKRQAELYVDCLEETTGQRPVIFYTNGYETWIWDDALYPPRPVAGFYTQDELQLVINRRTSRRDIAKEPINRDITERYYQEEASRRVMEALSTENKRKALIVMATGSGKTRLAIAMVDILMRCNWVRRVLFLADRVALVNQAKRAFNAFLPHASVTNLSDSKEDPNARIVFSTYPTMMNCIDGTRRDFEQQFSVGHFDLIIIDEAHRSVYQKFGAIFEYFDGLLLGLTATPKAEVDRNTYRLFELDNHLPTYSYELQQAVDDRFLVPPKAVSVPVKFVREGIKYAELSAEEQEEYEDTFYDDELNQMPAEIGSAALNNWLFNEDTVEKVLKHLMEFGQKVEGGDKLGKTIIFAKNHKHAQYIVEQFDKNYPHLTGKFCRVIDHQVKYAQSLIDDLKIKEKYPQIAVSVDMLDTGIDVPEIVNLIFFKLVRSKTKFWQMVGRGTRLCEDLFGPGQDKEFFCVFDYCQNLEFFDANPDGYTTTTRGSVKQKIFRQRLNLVGCLMDQLEIDEPLKELRSDLLDQMHQVVSALNVDNFIVRPQRRHVEEFQDRARWDKLSQSDIDDIWEKLTGLPYADEDDEDARRFDLLVLNLQLAIAEGATGQDQYRKTIIDLAHALEEKQAIPTVAAQMAFILEVQTDEYWQHVTLPVLELLRRSLRGLIKFCDPIGPRQMVYTDFQDAIRDVGKEHELVRVDENLRDYRRKVERFIRNNQNHVTIKRLKNNEPITFKDLEALEEILFSEEGPVSRELFAKTYGNGDPLGHLIRRIVGLDRRAAKEAFSEFLSASPMSADQISFVDSIINHLVRNGVMEPKTLFDVPFTDFHHEGVAGVFPNRAGQLVELIREINANSEAA